MMKYVTFAEIFLVPNSGTLNIFLSDFFTYFLGRGK